MIQQRLRMLPYRWWAVTVFSKTVQNALITVPNDDTGRINMFGNVFSSSRLD